MSALLKLLTGLTVLAVMGTVTTDPTGDSVGDGTIVAPTAPRYANNAIFDLQDVSLEGRPATPGGSIILLPAEGDDGATQETDESQGEDGAAASAAGASGAQLDDVRSVLRVTLGAIDVSESTALGFGSVVIDLYLDGADGGREIALDGPDMLFPVGRGWEYAVRLTPDGATGYRYVAPDQAATVLAVPEEVPARDEGDTVGAGVTDLQVGVPLDYERVPVGVRLDGSTLTVETPWDFPGEVTVYALTGVHDPFNPTGWRPLADAPSPWAYSGGEQVVPVIDLLAPDQEAQERALRTGVLPLPAVPVRDPGTVWLLLMVVGVLVATAGLVLRRRVPSAPGRQLRTGLPPDPAASHPSRTPRQVHVVPPPPVADPDVEPVVREKVKPVVVSSEPDGTGDQHDTTGPAESVGDAEGGEPSQPAAATSLPESDTATPPSGPGASADPREAQPALSGISAFDSFVLFEVPPEDEQDDEGFRELTREVAVVKRRSVAGPPTPLTLGDGDGAASAGDDSA